MQQQYRKNHSPMNEWLFYNLTRICALFVLILLFGILITLFIYSYPLWEKQGFYFLTNTEWDPVHNHYGALIPVFGTLMAATIAIFLAVPVSFGIALFLTELCPTWLRQPLTNLIQLLAGIPSVIYGMWGLFIFAPFYADYIQPFFKSALGSIPYLNVIVSGSAMGIGIVSAAIILAIMIVPFITSVMCDVFAVVPQMLKESAYGLGATTTEVAIHVILPYTKVGVIGGIILGLGRALGETMAVTFMIGNIYHINWSMFQAGNSITSVLANEFSEVTSDQHEAALFALCLLLFIITMIVLTAGKLLLKRIQKKEGIVS
jgi:phosphate transport system permease protein